MLPHHHYPNDTDCDVLNIGHLLQKASHLSLSRKKKVWGASVVNLKFLLRSVFKVLRAAFTITAAVLGKFTTYLLLYFDLFSASILLYFPL